MAEFCKFCWQVLYPEDTETELVESEDDDFCEMCCEVGKVVVGVVKATTGEPGGK